jgi:hypothetical protein
MTLDLGVHHFSVLFPWQPIWDTYQWHFLLAHADGLVIPSKEGLPTDTITLKWCTPKSNVIGMYLRLVVMEIKHWSGVHLNLMSLICISDSVMVSVGNPSFDGITKPSAWAKRKIS